MALFNCDIVEVVFFEVGCVVNHVEMGGGAASLVHEVGGHVEIEPALREILSNHRPR